jgi:hypothetical protein
VVHGDVAGVEVTRRNLSDWLDWMGLIDAGNQARLDRHIGYYEPYATSHDKLDAMPDVFALVENAAKSLVNLVRAMRNGTYRAPDEGLRNPRQK